MAAESASGIPLELIALVTPLPADGGPVPGEIIEHEAHAIGHAAVLLADRGVLLAGDMLSDVLIPLLDPRRPDQVGAYETALDRLERGRQARRRPGPRPRRRCRGSRDSGPPRRRSCLHRRAAARRGTGRRAAGPGLALRPPPVEPGAGPRAVGPSAGLRERQSSSATIATPVVAACRVGTTTSLSVRRLLVGGVRFDCVEASISDQTLDRRHGRPDPGPVWVDIRRDAPRAVRRPDERGRAAPPRTRADPRSLPARADPRSRRPRATHETGSRSGPESGRRGEHAKVGQPRADSGNPQPSQRPK